MPTVTVIIPTFRHRNFIVATLESVFAQTFADYEVIVVNDGSPDDTAAVLRPYIDAGRIHYIMQPNAGQAAARNRGLVEARGEFIAFLDDDDVWPADKLAWQVAELRSAPALVIVGGSVRLIGEQGQFLVDRIQTTRDVDSDDLLGGCPFHSPGQTLIRRSAIAAIGGFDSTIWGADDFDLYLKLSGVGPVQVNCRISLHYRIHAANASKHKLRMLRSTLTVLKRHLSGRRPAVSQQAYRWLYEYAGRELALSVRESVGSAGLRTIVRDGRGLSNFVAPAMRDPGLAWQLIGDLIPTRIGNNWRMRFGRILSPMYAHHE